MYVPASVCSRFGQNYSYNTFNTSSQCSKIALICNTHNPTEYVYLLTTLTFGYLQYFNACNPKWSVPPNEISHVFLRMWLHPIFSIDNLYVEAIY